MNFQLTHESSETTGRLGARRLVAALGAVLILGAVAGTAVVKEQGSQHSPSARIERTLVPAAPVMYSGRPPAVFYEHGAPRATQSRWPTTFYLVDSQEQADALEATLGQVMNDWTETAQIGPQSVIGVIDSPDSERAFYQDADESPSAQIIDLRRTIYYLVSTPDEAASVGRAIGGEQAVHVVTDPDDEAKFRQSVAGHAAIVDLRPLEGVIPDGLPD